MHFFINVVEEGLELSSRSGTAVLGATGAVTYPIHGVPSHHRSVRMLAAPVSWTVEGPVQMTLYREGRARGRHWHTRRVDLMVRVA